MKNTKFQKAGFAAERNRGTLFGVNRPVRSVQSQHDVSPCGDITNRSQNMNTKSILFGMVLIVSVLLIPAARADVYAQQAPAAAQTSASPGLSSVKVSPAISTMSRGSFDWVIQTEPSRHATSTPSPSWMSMSSPVSRRTGLSASRVVMLMFLP